MNRRSLACVSAFVFLATGCASTSREAELGIGWRKATVLRLGEADAFGPPVTGDCRARAEDADRNADQNADRKRRFALVEYFSGRIAHRRVVPIASGQDVTVGEPLYVSLLGCRESVSR